MPFGIKLGELIALKGDNVRLIKMFGLTVLAVVSAVAFVGATSASALPVTQICKKHGPEPKLECVPFLRVAAVHSVLQAGTVGKLLSSLVDVLCLGVLAEAEALELASPQVIHTTSQSFTGCGTGSAHSNCTVTVEELPLNTLLKIGLDAGVLKATSGRTRLVCSNLGINCVYDLEGTEFAVGGSHLTAEETPTIELGGKFFCPNEGFLDGLLETLESTYVLG